MSTRHRATFLVGSLAATIALGACGGSDDPTATITRREFQRIDIGMTYPKVRRIVGGPGTLTSSTSNAAGFRGATYTWSGPSSEGRATIVFANGTVFSKSQTGLR